MASTDGFRLNEAKSKDGNLFEEIQKEPTNMNTLSTSQHANHSNMSVVTMLAACAAFALLVLAGAIVAQSQQQASSYTKLAYCAQPRNSWLTLPIRLRIELEQNCSAQFAATAK